MYNLLRNERFLTLYKICKGFVKIRKIVQFGKDTGVMKSETRPKNRKTDRRTLYTKNTVKDALLEALEEKSFERITVTDVCRRAEITRATFYLHYQTLTEVLDELLSDALRMAEDNCENPDADILQILHLLAGVRPEHLKDKESLLPVCHRVAQLPKYQVIFHDETISNYVVNRIFQSQKQNLVPVYMDACRLSKKEAEMLTLFVITGTYNVNKALNWTKNDAWYKIHSMLFRFMSGGYAEMEKEHKPAQNKTVTYKE